MPQAVRKGIEIRSSFDWDSAILFDCLIER
jgi:hypothetical protein